ncbi:MAG TPA: response regulator transcription factor [Fimbriimonadaceae bacterium]|nr:response regulator transcription factor [Fimbriimonadaceae bacterium]
MQIYSEAVKILVVEDEQTAAEFLCKGLREEKFLVDSASTSDEADELVLVNEYDAILLDVMIPGQDGFALCQSWRKRGITSPILFLTARSDIADRVLGLDLGGDDYLVKPYAFEELLARVRVMVRRSGNPSTGAILFFGELRIDTRAQTAEIGGQPVNLTAKEYQMLEFLALNAGRLVTRIELWEHIWESYDQPDSNVVDVYIGYLRSKLGRDPDYIETRRGLGYIFHPVEA